MKERRFERDSSLRNMGTQELPMTMKCTRKRKSDDIGESNVENYASCPDFTVPNRIDKPVIVNCQEAFFDKNTSFPHERQPTDSPAMRFVNKERTIKPSKSFFDDDERVPCENTKYFSPKQSPRANFRKDFHRTPSYRTPTHTCTGGVSPLTVVDELFTGFYGCMPNWECSLPWRGDSDSDDGSEDEDNDYDGIVRGDMTRHDPKAVREHLSFPKLLGKEHAGQHYDETRREKNARSIHRTIRRTPSSRVTTLESDSRQKMPGSKMFRRTEINQVTEIHWDEKVVDTATLEQMAKLSVF